MSEINIAKLVGSFRFAVDKKSVKEIDDLLRKYSKKKIEVGTRIGKSTQTSQKQEEAGIRKLTDLDLKRFNQYKFMNALQKENLKLKRDELRLQNQLHAQALKENATRERAARRYGRTGFSMMDGAASPNFRGRMYERFVSGRSMTSNITGSNRTLGGSYHGVMAGTGLLSGFGLSALNNRLATLQSNQVGLRTVAGSSQEYDKQRQFLLGLGARIGATQAELVPEYTKFFANAQGTALEPHAQYGFESLTQYGKVLGLDSESMKGTFRAVSQMVNKQQIMAEELKGQLAERLPAAVKIMAKVASGGDTKKLFKMMEKGELDPNKYLPLFFQELDIQSAGGLEAYKNSIRGSQNFASVEWEKSLGTFGSQGGNQAFIDFWNKMSSTLPKLEPIFIGLARAATTLSAAIGAVADGLAYLASSKSLIENSFVGIGAAALLLGTKLGKAFLPITGVMMFLEDLAVYKSGKGGSLIGYVSGEEDEKLRLAQQAAIPENLRKKIIDNPLDPNYQAGSLSRMEEISKMAKYHPLTQSFANWWVGDNGIKLTPNTQMDAVANQFMSKVGGVNFSPESFGKSTDDSSTVVNITIDGITRKFEQDRNNTASFFNVAW